MFGRKTASKPAPALDKAKDAPHRAPATQGSCGSDYASGKDARKNLGKPA